MIAWPWSILTPRQESWGLTGGTAASGQGLSGHSQVVRLDGGGRWKYVCEVFLHGTERIRAARAMEAQLDGGATVVEVPMVDSDNATTYGDATAATPAIGANVLRATLVTFEYDGFPLEGGEHFSIDHPTVGVRLYRVARIDAFTASPTGGTYTCEIRPPLREAVTVGTVLDFANPRCTMRLEDPESLRVDLELGRFATISPSFVEVFS